ncbi:MAG: 30S ribosomal protein S16 [Candidatus Liptonbacteria bacterium]|nr:30S ribosomal protein S16 [Candidatus Liptonbacteria bacterium]
MLAIKLQRIGKKHQPSYRLVVAEKRSKLGGPPVEDLGAYDLRTKQLTAQKDRVAHWLTRGAQPTATVWNLLVSHNLASGKKIAVKMRKQKAENVAAGVAASTETPAPVPAEQSAPTTPAEA